MYMAHLADLIIALLEKGERVNIEGVAGYMVSAEDTQLCSCQWMDPRIKHK